MIMDGDEGRGKAKSISAPWAPAENPGILHRSFRIEKRQDQRILLKNRGIRKIYHRNEKILKNMKIMLAIFTFRAIISVFRVKHICETHKPPV